MKNWSWKEKKIKKRKKENARTRQKWPMRDRCCVKPKSKTLEEAKRRTLLKMSPFAPALFSLLPLLNQTLLPLPFLLQLTLYLLSCSDFSHPKMIHQWKNPKSLEQTNLAQPKKKEVPIDVADVNNQGKILLLDFFYFVSKRGKSR